MIDDCIEYKGRILVMDDDELVLTVEKAMLEKLGFETCFAYDGMDAIAKYKAAMESGSPYDAVIMDLTIPGGIGGRDAIKIMLDLDPNIKAIVASGFSSDPIMREWKQFGFSGMITKPHRMKDLRKILLDVLP